MGERHFFLYPRSFKIWLTYGYDDIMGRSDRLRLAAGKSGLGA